MATIEELADRFLDEYRKGLNPSVTEYAKQYPEAANEILELFPALSLLEKGGDRESLSSLSSTGSKPKQVQEAMPARIGVYKILREIGRGGMGIVYEAQDESLDRLVALKVLLSFHGERSEAIQRFQREAKMAARLHHTNVVPVFESGVFDNRFYYVMQYINGIGIDQLLTEMNRLKNEDLHIRFGDDSSQVTGSNPIQLDEMNNPSGEEELSFLDTSTKTRPINPVPPPIMPRSTFGRTFETKEEHGLPTEYRVQTVFEKLQDNPYLHSFSSLHQFVCQVGIQVAQALDSAERHGMVHRDIKPSNLLLDNQGIVWITDFGLAKPTAEHNLTQHGQIVGTLRYMAPEGLEGEFEPRSDLYSLGLTLYEILTLRPAFDETNYSRLFGQVSQANIIPPRKIDPTIPHDLETIILKATARDPKDRYQHGAELAEDFQRFLEERPIQARRFSSIELLWRWTRRNKLTASLLLSVAVLSLLLFVVMTTGFFRAQLLLNQKEKESWRAETNLRVALNAFDDIFSTIQNAEENILFPREDGTVSVSFGNSSVTEKEAKVLESLMKFYDQFVKENAKDRTLLFETAKAYANMGLIQQKLGHSKEAFDTYERALGFYEQGLALVVDPVRSVNTQIEKAELVNRFLIEHKRPGYRDDFIRKIINDSIDQLESIPSDSSYRYLAGRQLFKLYYYRAFTQLNEYLYQRIKSDKIDFVEISIKLILSLLRSDDNVMENVIRDVCLSRTILEGLLARDPDNNEYLLSKVKSNNFLSILSTLKNDRAESQRLEKEAFNITRELLKQSPNNPFFRAAEVDTLIISTYSIRIQPDSKVLQELPQLKVALDKLIALREDFPRTPQFAISTIMVEYNIGALFQLAGQNDQAVEYFEKCYQSLRDFQKKFPTFYDFQLFPPLYYKYSLLLIAMKKYDKAQALLDEIDLLYKTKDAVFNSDILRWKPRLQNLRKQLPSRF